MNVLKEMVFCFGFISVLLICSTLGLDNNHAESPPVFDPKDLHLMLYTFDGKVSEIILGKEDSLKNFEKSLDIKILIHGFGTNGTNYWITDMKDSFLKMKFNVLIVDWGFFCPVPYYDTAKNNTIPVGIHVAKILDWITERFGKKSENFHVIGHSLGAHVAGIIGHAMLKKPGRITGLDAAFPKYQNEPLENRLDETDGHFVDVIHTNGGSLFEGGLAFFDPIGHVDFYPNGGKSQPGCNTYRNWFPFLPTYYLKKIEGSCNHRRSIEFFMESVHNPNAFLSRECESYSTYQKGDCLLNSAGRMGYFVSEESKGSYYLTTRATEPFNGQEYQIKIAINTKQEKTFGRILIQFFSSNETDGALLLHDGMIDGEKIINSMIAVSSDMIDPHLVEFIYYARSTSYPQSLSVDKMQILISRTKQRLCTGPFTTLAGMPLTAGVVECDY